MADAKRKGLDDSFKRGVFMKSLEHVEVQDYKFGKGQEDSDYDKMSRSCEDQSTHSEKGKRCVDQDV